MLYQLRHPVSLSSILLDGLGVEFLVRPCIDHTSCGWREAANPLLDRPSHETNPGVVYTAWLRVCAHPWLTLELK